MKKSDQHYDFFALEADRDTMPVNRNGKGSSIARKIDAYREIMTARAYQSRLNVPNLRVLFVTVSQAKAQAVLDIVERAGGLAWFYVKALPQYADPFKSVPPLPELYTTPWRRGGFADAGLDQSREPRS